MILSPDSKFPPGRHIEQARFPEHYRPVPGELPQEQVLALTVPSDAEAAIVDSILEQFGFAVFTKDVLESRVPLAKAMQASKTSLEWNGSTGYTLKVFLDASDGHGSPGYGDGSKTMKPFTRKGSCPHWSLASLLVGLVSPGHQVESIAALHSTNEQYCGAPHTQAQHSDQMCHLTTDVWSRPDGVSERNLQQYSRLATSPRTMLLNMSDKPIRVVVHLGSHVVAYECMLFYARHYWSLWQLWSQEYPGKTEQDFFPVWTEVVEQHLQHRFPERKPSEPMALTLQPKDGVFFLGSCQHAGTSDAGHRLFLSFVATLELLKRHGFIPELFQTGKGKADPAENSYVAGGLLSLFPSPPGAINPCPVRESLKAATVAKCRNLSRQQKQEVESLCDTVLNYVEVNGLKIVQKNLLSISSDKDHDVHVIGLVCKVTAAHPKHAVVWVEPRMSLSSRKLDTNAAVVRGAVFAVQLMRRLRRSPFRILHPVCDYPGVWRSQASGGHVLYRAIIEIEGEPLEVYWQANCAQMWSNQRLLTEEGRYVVQSTLRCADALHHIGFFWIFFHVAMFSYNPRLDIVQLVQPGIGYIFDEHKPLCNRGRQFRGQANQGPTAMARYCTEVYADTDCPQEYPPASVNKAVWLELQTRRQENAVAAHTDTEDGDPEHTEDAEVDSLRVQDLEGASAAVDLSCSMLYSLWSKISPRKSIGLIGAKQNFLRAELNPLSNAAGSLDPVSLAVGDMHQLYLHVANWFHPYSRDFEAWKQQLSSVLTVACPREKVDAMTTFLLGGPLGGQGQSQMVCRQPLALGRLAQFLSLGLAKETETWFAEEASSCPYVATPVFSPDHELQISSQAAGCGISMEIKVDVFPDDPEWMQKSRMSLKCFDQKGLEELRRNPRRVLLKAEEGKGVGVLGVGEFAALTFFCWYVGRAGDGFGRYVVSFLDGEKKHCDGAPCKALPLKWLLEKGIAGPFINGALTDCNLVLERLQKFEHNGLIWIPMSVSKAFRDAFASWHYNHIAVKGKGLAT